MEISTNSLRSHWVLQVYMTSNNETVSRQSLIAGNIAKICDMTEGNIALFTLGNIEIVGKLSQ